MEKKKKKKIIIGNMFLKSDSDLFDDLTSQKLYIFYLNNLSKQKLNVLQVGTKFCISNKDVFINKIGNGM
jgi:hypothetical protein